MSKYLKLFFLLFSTLLSFHAFSQSSPPEMPGILPPAPNAAELGKYGSIPVNLSTGAINYSLPLMSLSSGTIKLDVALAYGSGGIKVDQIASRSGLGWILNAGGVINRTVYGDKDETANNAIKPVDISLNTLPVIDFLDKATRNKDNYDTQPDIFNFNFNGYSGRFILDSADKTKVIFLERSNLKVVVNFGGTAWTIKVTDPNGVKYYFGGNDATETSRTSSAGPGCGKSYSSAIPNAWYLNKIENLSGDNIVLNYLPIEFTYETAASQSIMVQDIETRTEFLHDFALGTDIYPAPGSSSSCVSSVINEGVILDNIISSRGEQIQFSYITRSDLDGDKLFSKLEYGLVGDTALKTFDFTYVQQASASYNSASVTVENQYRPFLTQIKEYSKGLTDYKTYEFHYYHQDGLPPRLSYAQDTYGFFNGQNNTTFLPAYETSGLFSYSVANRSSSPTYSNYGLLSKVIYPTLGTDSVIYEGHSTNENIPAHYEPTSHSFDLEGYGASTRSEVDYTTDITLDANQIIRVFFDVTYSGTGVNDLIHQGANVTITNLGTSVDVYHQSLLIDESVSNDPLSLSAGSYRITVTGVGRAGLGHTYFTYLNGSTLIAEQNNTKVVGGVRVKQVITRDPFANKNMIKSYNYNRYAQPTVSSGKLLRPTTDYFSEINMRVANSSFNDYMINTYIVASSDGNSSLYAENGNHISYTDVAESDGTDLSNGATLHQYVLREDNRPFLERGIYFGHMPTGISGLPAVEEKYQLAFKIGEDSEVLKQKEVFLKYKHIPFKSVRGYLGRKNFDIDALGGDDPYDLVAYDVESYWNYNDSTETITYDVNGLNPTSIITENLYDDSTHLQLTRSRTRLSDGRLITKQMSYPQEMVNTSQDPMGVYAAMIAVNEIAPVIEEKELLPSNYLISSKRTTYHEFFTNLFLPQTVYTYNNISTVTEPRINFLKYDNKGNPLSLAKENGLKSCYVWSFSSTLPVIEIKNVDYAVFESTIGMLNISSFSSLTNPSKTTIDAFVSTIKTAFPDASVTSYSHIIGVGIKSITDAKGLSTYYEYDSYGRLQNKKDKDGNIVKSYAYAFAPSSPSSKNYIQETLVKVSGKTDTSALAGLTISQVNKNIQYLDGLGRPLQTVQWKASPSQKDLVQIMDFDVYGREVKKYLLYAEQTSDDGSFKSTGITNQVDFYSTLSGWDANIPKTAQPFSVSVFDHSPLNKIIEQGATGAVWQPYNAGILGSGHTVKIEECTNLTTDSVRLWVVTSTGAETTINYANGTLIKTVTKDENWTSGKTGTWEEFKDKRGRIILKKIWQSENNALKTWYVYNDLGNLSYVIPPGVNTNSTISFIESDSIFTDLIYGYHYDGRNRMIEMKIPGKGWDYMVYNKLDQLVMSQDANLRTANKWLLTRYDVLGRVIMTGILGSSSNRSTWQTTINTDTVLWESRDNANASAAGTGYTKNTLPAHSLVERYYTVSYYDDYNFFGLPTKDVYNLSTSYSTKTKSLLTGKRVNVIGTADYLWGINYYDDEGQVVKAVQQHYLGASRSTGNYDIIENHYNFAHELEIVDRTHFVLSIAKLHVKNIFTYDHMGRKLSTTSKINGNPAVVLSRLDYNEIGQLKQKNLHSTDNGSSFLQNTKFAYNERGWLKASTSTEFKMKLGYDTTANPQYNGNISLQEWGSSYGNKFLYSYDPLNRLTNGVSTGITMSEAITYDKMGNIKTLNRDGVGTSTYSYNNGNQLNSISGLSIAMVGSYAYDSNGNATTDGLTGVTLTYNVLNLPVTATKSGLNLTYTYTAMGQKLKKVSNVEGTTEYINGIQYQDGLIDFVQTEDGLARRIDTTYTYEYNLTDHLGNVRYTFNKHPVTGALQKLQEDNYYAFGMRKIATGGNNKYLYNGKELQDELGQYDYGARFYDPVIGRFNSMDPHAHEYPTNTPYNYAFNNPVLVVDPNGKDGVVTGAGTKDDPYVIKANYYYHGLDADASKGLNDAVAAYNNSGVTEIKSKDGSTYVKYDLSATEVKDKAEADQRATADMITTPDKAFRFGNTVTSGTAAPDALGNAGNKDITLDVTKAKAMQEKFPGISLAAILAGDAIHELGHNLAGNHGDPGTMMIGIIGTEDQKSNSIGASGTGTYRYSLPSVNANGTRAIIGRMDMPRGTVGSKYLTEREVKKIDPDGTVGRISHIEKQ